jgi:DUF971 family protein
MTSDAARHTPLEIHAPKGARRMVILFEDGHEAVIPHEVLRGFCPCADCQGHGSEIKFIEGGDLEVLDLGEVGNYALRLTWGDRHATGIYSFRYLRDLCCCVACTPTDPKDRKPVR